MRVVTILLALLFLSKAELYSQSSAFRNLYYTIDSMRYNDSEIERIDNMMCSDDHVHRLRFTRHGSTDPEDIGLVTGLHQFLRENWTTIYEFLPPREIWQWQYKSIEVDTLSITGSDIVSLLDCYDGKDSTTYEYKIDYKPLNLEFFDLYNKDKIGGYRRYYILRIDSVASNTIIYYHLSDEPIEDIFKDKELSDGFGPNVGYINYEGRPILVCGDAAGEFFKRDSTIIMSPTYLPRVERTSKKYPEINPYLYGDIKGFYIYNKEQGLELRVTGEVPYWRDREIYLDDIRRMLFGNPYTYRPYHHPIEELPRENIKRYMTPISKKRQPR